MINLSNPITKVVHILLFTITTDLIVLSKDKKETSQSHLTLVSLRNRKHFNEELKNRNWVFGFLMSSKNDVLFGIHFDRCLIPGYLKGHSFLFSNLIFLCVTFSVLKTLWSLQN